MYLAGHYQNAYVTHDIDRAIEDLGERFGLRDFTVLKPEMVFHTPDGDKPASVRAGFAWAGGLQIELIQPLGGFVDHYLPYLPQDPQDPTPRFHHTAVRRDDRDAMRAEIAQLGLPLAFEGEVPGLLYIYLDGRQSLGHYCEYVWASPEGWDLMGWPQGRPIL
ncbi:VOC family protein [Novosphingobium sp. 9U]|uniref:VOC family protein n=1 Tax=Novosphingobium sp. 9U TaxID=2653158 RepID=UPI0012F436F7|nr:VOC family protein [Novosphingobium sp. 9U]VWX48246.1 conserved hypothetical protein [Novosphingobium sp. 9U]